MRNEMQEFYQNKYNENERMQRQPLEFFRCKEIISRYIDSDNMEIADIGGATGSFSLYTLGDARQIPYSNDTFDIVLEMGPLYHLQNERDRIQCLSEARRTLKSGGTIICEAISRYANLFEGFRHNLIEDDRFVDILNENLESGNHSPGDTPYFTTAFFHTPEILVEELKQAGFCDISIIAVEGFGFSLDVDSVFSDPHKKKLLLKYIKETESNPDLIGISGHFMAVGKKIGDNL